jgi:hypothetical protein
MRKELFFAILAGAALGLIIAFGVWRMNSSLSPNTNPNHQAEASPIPTAENNFAVTLTKIANNDVITTNPLTIAGLTKPLSQVAISAQSKDYLTAAGSNGEFSQDITLDSGINQLLIDSFDQGGSFSENITPLVFSSEFAKYQTATSSGSISDQVQQKVTEALNKPTADIGSITDIAETTLQVKTEQGEILQVSAATDTDFVKNLDNKSTTIKLTDLAIGDYVVAMGTTNGNKVLEAKRILVTNPPGKIQRNILFGRIASSTNKALTFVTLKDQKSYQIAYDKNTDFLVQTGDKVAVIKLAKIADDDMVFTFNNVGADGSLTARTVIVVRDAASSPTPALTPTIAPKK